MATLIIQRADATRPDRVMRVDGKIVYLGRSPKCTVQLNDPTVSRLHAALVRQADGGWALVRHKSAQPIWVDGESVDKRPLCGGESIRIGGFTILFDANDAAVEGVTDETVRGQPAIAEPADLSGATLFFEAGGPAAEPVQLARVVTVFGRGDECDVVLDDQRCSRRHMEIGRVGDGFILRDLGSTNGVLVNGERVYGEIDLIAGDVIQVGGVRMRFEIEENLDPVTIPATADPAVAAAPSDPSPAPFVAVIPVASPTLLDRWLKATPLFQVASALTAAVLVSVAFFIAMVLSRRPAVEKGIEAPKVRTKQVAPMAEKPARGRPPKSERVVSSEREADETASNGGPLPADVSRPESDATVTAESEEGSARSSRSAPDEEDEFADATDAAKPEPSFADLLTRGGSSEAESEEEPGRERGDEDETPSARDPADAMPEKSEDASVVRLPVPDAAEVAAALANINEVYADDLTTSGALGSTLSKLLSAAEKSAKPASKYALLVAAEQKAVQEGDFAEAIDVIDKRAEMFECDALQGRLDMLREASKSAAEADDGIFDLTMALTAEAIHGERYGVAAKAATLAVQVAASLEQPSLPKASARSPTPSVKSGGSADDAPKTTAAKQLRQAVSEYRRLHQKYEQARGVLEETPDDAKSLEAVGKYLCFVKENWQDGLPALAKGSEGSLQELATQELALRAAVEAAPAEVFALAGEWWALTDAPRRSGDLAAGVAAVKMHAASLYGRIVDGLSDPIEAELAKKRIATAAEESPPWRVDSPSSDAF